MLRRFSAMPYVFWSAVFIIIPLLLVAGYSITMRDPDTGSVVMTLENFQKFVDPLYLKVLWRSVRLAGEATLICLILGYPMAMILAKMPAKTQRIAALLFVLPMWMNFLLRTYAWMFILGKTGIVNRILVFFGLPAGNFLYNEGAVLLGMVYNFLPFMVLPIYTVLTKIDSSIVEAAEDLGANAITVFRRIIVPLSIPGIISGITMVFMPAVSTFVISALLGGGQFMLVGNLVEQQFLLVNNWHFGSAISMILMVLILISMAVLNRYDTSEVKDGGVSMI